MNDGIPPGFVCEIATGRNRGRRVRITQWAKRVPRLDVMTGKTVHIYAQEIDPIDELEGGPHYPNAGPGHVVAIALCTLKPI